VTDGRFSGATRGLMVGHVAPEAARGGPIALVRDGDAITIDIDAKRLTLELGDDELAQRRAAWQPPPASRGRRRLRPLPRARRLGLRGRGAAALPGLTMQGLVTRPGVTHSTHVAEVPPVHADAGQLLLRVLEVRCVRHRPRDLRRRVRRATRW